MHARPAYRKATWRRLGPPGRNTTNLNLGTHADGFRTIDQGKAHHNEKLNENERAQHSFSERIGRNARFTSIAPASSG